MELKPNKMTFGDVVVLNVVGIGLAKLLESAGLGTNYVDAAEGVSACLHLTGRIRSW